MARAVSILPGLYNLNNHPDGGARPPLYGARWDGLFTPSAAVVAATGSDSTIFTTNFDHPLSAMFMDYDDIAGTIHIFGTSWGGRDDATFPAPAPDPAPPLDDYIDDIFRGLFTIDFTYTGIVPVPGDDDLWCPAASCDGMNSGFITAPSGLGTVFLEDKAGSHPFTFRLGDEDDDAGHRGFAGISGWGWLNYTGAAPPPLHHFAQIVALTFSSPPPRFPGRAPCCSWGQG